MITYALDARTATNHFPGIGRYVRNLARALVPLLAADERLVIIYDPRASEPWLDAGDERRILWAPLPVSPFSLRQQIEVPRLLRVKQVDVYHSTYYLMPYRPGIPALLTFYDLIPQLFPDTVSPRARLLAGVATRLALRAAERVVTISGASRADLLRYYPGTAGRVTAIPLAPDPVFVPQPKEVIAAVRTQHGLPVRFSLYIGSNKPHKNLVRLITAWARLPAQEVLVIAGAWDARYPAVREAVAALGLGARVRFLGRIADTELPALYSAATLFVFPSLYEGFGLPVVEAMACGTPVACSDRSSLPEAGGDAVCYFNPLDERQMSAVLARLLADDDLRATLREKGLAQAARFSWRQTAAETLANYRELVG